MLGKGFSREGVGFRERAAIANAKRTTGRLDGQDIFDRATERAVDADWELYKHALTFGMRGMTNPPRWLTRAVRKERGMAALQSHAMVTDFGLTKRENEAVVHHCVFEKTQSEIAVEWGVTQQAVSKLVDKGLSKIRRASIAEWNHEDII